jgi:hypothetical protein
MIGAADVGMSEEATEPYWPQDPAPGVLTAAGPGRRPSMSQNTTTAMRAAHPTPCPRNARPSPRRPGAARRAAGTPGTGATGCVLPFRDGAAAEQTGADESGEVDELAKLSEFKARGDIAEEELRRVKEKILH